MKITDEDKKKWIANQVNYVESGMSREETLEAMLKGCLDVIDAAEFYVSHYHLRDGSVYTGINVDTKIIRKYINYPKASK